ncbi:hypothetical protein EJ110_NYTH24986 [Nymphaea thermarum]|nr:hypothetical protein EJ110_NYTH24986 [Nymphaea thermarum]
MISTPLKSLGAPASSTKALRHGIGGSPPHRRRFTLDHNPAVTKPSPALVRTRHRRHCPARSSAVSSSSASFRRAWPSHLDVQCQALSLPDSDPFSAPAPKATDRRALPADPSRQQEVVQATRFTPARELNCPGIERYLKEIWELGRTWFGLSSPTGFVPNNWYQSYLGINSVSLSTDPRRFSFKGEFRRTKFSFGLRAVHTVHPRVAKLEVHRRDTRRVWRFRLDEPGRERSRTVEALRSSAAVGGLTRLIPASKLLPWQLRAQLHEMGTSRKQFNPDEPIVEEVPAGQHEVSPSKLQGQVPLFAMERILTIEKELAEMRSDWNKAEHFRKRDLDRQNLDRQKEMEEVRAMFRQIAINQTQTAERAIQGPDKGKGVMGGPGHQTDTEINPNNLSHVETSNQGAKLMGPPPVKNQAEPNSEFMRTPRGPWYSHIYRTLTYDDTKGEDKSPLHPRKSQRETTRSEERRKPSVKYEFPKFNGEQFREWLFMAERYFLCHHVPQDEWIEIATANMTGEARTHYLWFAHKTANPTWERFRASLQLHFADSTFIDYDQDLKNLVQTTTVATYQKQFERLASMVQWPEKALIGAFKGGLRKDIKRQMKIHRFEILEECFSMARVYEENIEEEKEERREKKERNARKSDKQKKRPSYSSASRNRERAIVPSQGGNKDRPNQRQARERPTRYLTPQQIEEYKRKGLRFWCDGKWDKNHQCKQLYNIVVVDDSECSSSSESVLSSSSSSSFEEEIQVKKKGTKKAEPEEKAPTEEEKSDEVESLHSIQDPYKANAMRVFGRINGQ